MTKSKAAANLKTNGGKAGKPAIARMKKRAPRDIELVVLETGDVLDFMLTDEQFDNQCSTNPVNGVEYPGMLVQLYKNGDKDQENEYFCFPGIFERSVQEYTELDERYVKTNMPRNATRCTGTAVDAYQSGKGDTYNCFKQLQGHLIRVTNVTPVTTLAYGGGGLIERNIYQLEFDDPAKKSTEK